MLRLLLACAVVFSSASLPGSATAAQIRVEVQARVFNIFSPVDGEQNSVDEVNGTGLTLSLDDVVRGVITYDSAVTGIAVTGTTGNSAVYGDLFGPDPIVEAEFFLDETQLISTTGAARSGDSVSVFDSLTMGLEDVLELGLSFAPPAAQSTDGWAIRLVLTPPDDFGSTDLPGPEIIGAPWNFESDPGLASVAWGVVSTTTTSTGIAEWDAFVTSVSITEVPEASHPMLAVTSLIVLAGLRRLRNRDPAWGPPVETRLATRRVGSRRCSSTRIR